ncbi:MAG TPA: amidase [Acidimicrobiales bacterium]|nr:amidase [Acidimicrobiales bacterium]
MTTWLERWPAGEGAGPTVAVKDLIDVAGSVTTAGCKTLADHGLPAVADAACIRRIRQAGGRLVGKTNLHELAFGTSGINAWFGTPPNPADPGRVPGGSSSGSAAAVALGEADVALGSDTGGSIRIPAACCAVVGLKTTYGLVSLEGVWPLAPSYDTVGVLARDVRGVVMGMEMLGIDMASPGVPESLGRAAFPPAVAVDPVIDAAVDDALAGAGLHADEVAFLDWIEVYRAQQRLLAHEAFECDGHLLEIDGGAGVSEEIRSRLRFGSEVSEAETEEARALGESWTRRLGEVMRRHTVLALPTLATRPPRLDEFGPGFNLLTAPVNFAGFPAISLPVPVAVPNRPACGLQLVSRPGSEALLCALAAVVEAAVAP